MKSAPAIAFDYVPSRWIAGAVVALTLLALLALALSALPAALSGALGVAALVHAAVALRSLLREAPRRLSWHAAGHWRIVDARGIERIAELHHATVRGAWIALALRGHDGASRSIVLAPDNSDADTRRRLRVRLARGGPQVDGHAAA